MAQTREEKLKEIESKLAEIRVEVPEIKEKVETAEEMRVAGIPITPITEITEVIPELPEIPDQITDAEKVADRAVAGAEAVIGTVEYWEARAKEMEERIKVAEVPEKKWYEKLIKEPEITREERLAEERIRLGIPEISEDVKSQRLKVAGIQGEMSKLEAKYLTDVDREYGMVAEVSVPIVEAKTRELERIYRRDRAYKAAELSAEAAVLQAFQGNLTDARNLANDAVNAFVYDQEQDRRRLEFMFEYHSDYLATLRDDQRDILDNALDEARRKETEAKENAQLVMGLMIDNPKAGVKTTDTPEQAAIKVRDYLAALPEEVELLSVSEAKALGLPFGTTRQQAIAKGLVPGVVIPKEWTDEEIMVRFRQMRADELSYQQALDEITMSESLLNKDRARFIIAREYGEIEPGTTFEQFMGIPPKEITPEELAERRRRLGLTLDIPEFGALPVTTTPFFE